MILRECSTGWLLMHQTDHAGLSAQLASRMHLPPVDALGCREVLIAAIASHDDGWSDWDNAIHIDPDLGRPLGFDEMARSSALPIWRSSVEAATKAGDLAGWCVASHFRRLAGRGEQDEATAAWQRWAQSEAQKLLDSWLSENSKHSECAAEKAAAWLRYFDTFSLNLCRGPQSAPFPLESPQGTIFELIWEDEARLRIDPWPFQRDKLQLSMPATRFAMNGDLEPIEIGWSLSPT